jgi:hypothetical protein
VSTKPISGHLSSPSLVNTVSFGRLRINLNASEGKDVVIVSQLKEGGQRPDVQILSPIGGREAVIELKLWASLQPSQLTYARTDKTRLVVITMDPLPFGLSPQIIEVRWSRVEQWLNDVRPTVGEASKFMLSQFTSFVEGRRQSGEGGGVLTFIVPKPYPDRFQHVLVPLVRKEASINGLTELFLNGISDHNTEPELHLLFGDHGCVDAFTPHGDIRDWIIQTLIKKGLAPDSGLHKVFKFVAYTPNGEVVSLDVAKLGVEIGFDVPLRIICRPKWFELYGDNPARKYFGGNAADQGGFYGPNGRFPLRRGTEIPGDLRTPNSAGDMQSWKPGDLSASPPSPDPAKDETLGKTPGATEVKGNALTRAGASTMPGQTGSPRARLRFIRTPDPDPAKFQYALTPLVMKEFSIRGLSPPLQKFANVFWGSGGVPSLARSLARS